MPRIQRPGEDDPVPSSAAKDRRRKKRAPNNPGNNKRNNRGGGGGGGKRKSRSQSGAITDITDLIPDPITGEPVEVANPVLFDDDSAYGRKPDKPYLDTPKGIYDANANPQEYFQSLMAASGLGGGPGQNPVWRDFVANRAYEMANSAYQRARFVNPELGFAQFAQTMGVPRSAANHAAGPQVPMGTGQPAAPVGAAPAVGQPIDTGNPFTSSSGVGAPAAPAGLPAVGPRPNRKRRPNQFRRWRQGRNAAGAAATPGVAANPLTAGVAAEAKGGKNGLNQINPPSGAGATAPDLGGFAALWRKQFLSQDPVTRGEGGAVASVPGRWSPWG